MSRCAGANARHQPCRNWAQPGSSWCRWHEAEKIECVGGPWDGLALAHHRAVVYLTFEANELERDPLAAGWCMWVAALEAGERARGAYLRDDRSHCWRWCRRGEVPESAAPEDQRTQGTGGSA